MVKLLAVLSIIGGLILGIGMSMLGTSLIPGIDEQMQIIIAIVLSIFAAMSLYFMTKGAGSSS
jgi:membrane protein implicated in regulation of membrane protease activity